MSKRIEEATSRMADLLPARFDCTDIGNAKRLLVRHGDDLHFVEDWGKWLVWDGGRWRIDNTGEVMRRAKATAATIIDECVLTDQKDEIEQIKRHALRSQSFRSLRDMVSAAASELPIPIEPKSLDKNIWLLNVANGTIDLQTGKPRDANREDLLTKRSPIEYDEKATCPLWLAFLERIMKGNQEMIVFLQRAVGYSLTGAVTERCIFIMHGGGKNGKSTFLETLRAVFGDYAMRTHPQTLLAKKDDAIPHDVARLRGARFVTASETAEGKRLDEALIKDITGGDTIAARFLHQSWFEFKPEFKIWLGTNHKPEIGSDRAMWDRIKLIPFDVRIPESEQDPILATKLLAELPGILAWAVQGCVEWQKHGLIIPAEVLAATNSYQAEMDRIASFLSDCCVTDPSAKVSKADLYETYKNWCGQNGYHHTNKSKFGNRLLERGIDEGKSGDTRLWKGIGLLFRDIGTDRDTEKVNSSTRARAKDTLPFSRPSVSLCPNEEETLRKNKELENDPVFYCPSEKENDSKESSQDDEPPDWARY